MRMRMIHVSVGILLFAIGLHELPLTEASRTSSSDDISIQVEAQHDEKPYPHFRVGDIVEYDSRTYGRWLLGRVEALNGQYYKLKLEDGLVQDAADPAKVRKHVPFPVGTLVEYNSRSYGRWVTAKVEGWDGESYRLDINDFADPLKVRSLARGTLVEYYSISNGRWVPARVLGWADNYYQLDINPQADPLKVRKYLPFPTGSLVDYSTDSNRGWVVAKVLGWTGDSYRLDVDSRADPSRVREHDPKLQGGSEHMHVIAEETQWHGKNQQQVSQDEGEETIFDSKGKQAKKLSPARPSQYTAAAGDETVWHGNPAKSRPSSRGSQRANYMEEETVFNARGKQAARH
eukprot:gnl/TRDRNA2_/TRDRNA2_152109_c0_seq1.p1 gnl/TRDRNA2_/TRDRNA2_152109_c0~~gnl/TRDRNA2_/TRDRNA2_152109_c0_seq1.p1  ORF type:complete len:346 (-),score=39.63 gnl/TRDRNA2_/TRDRNA2_152109_c0_seq1:172-1209(-)